MFSFSILVIEHGWSSGAINQEGMEDLCTTLHLYLCLYATMLLTLVSWHQLPLKPSWYF